jgi:hypothetical protein
MSQQVLEGTWDELAEHADELRHHKNLRLIIEPDDEPKDESNGVQQTLAERFAGRVGQCSFEPSDLSERTGEVYAELLAKKYAENQKR